MRKQLIPVSAALIAAGTVACQQDESLGVVDAIEVRDSAGGGNGIRSHVLIGVQGVP